MDQDILKLQESAKKVIYHAIIPEGIMAIGTKQQTENYTRIWARDAVMTGITGLLIEDQKIIEGLKASLQTLKDHQSTSGIIPSNVGISPLKVSYGGTAGRVDATLWYIIGVLLFEKLTDDKELYNDHLPHLLKCMEILEAWEFNHKHLIYTPLSGNWADEYPLHGYTLYDNCLRLWGLKLFADKTKKKEIQKKAIEVEEQIRINFWTDTNPDHPNLYHPLLYNRTFASSQLYHPAAAFNPGQYYTMFDCGANGLALILRLFDDVLSLEKYVETMAESIQKHLIPAFWPVIQKGDDLWKALENNHMYDFKNHPHHFHNGGIWPIMMGWLALGFAFYQNQEVAKKLLSAYLQIAKDENFRFSEYIASDSLEPGGKSPLCYSASGALLMIYASKNNNKWSETNLY